MKPNLVIHPQTLGEPHSFLLYLLYKRINLGSLIHTYVCSHVTNLMIIAKCFKKIQNYLNLDVSVFSAINYELL